MTVGQLKRKIQNLPDDMDVFMDERTSEFEYGLLNTATPMLIPFRETPEGPVMANDTVLVLSEEII